jgi:hypothetical protein
MLIDRAILVNLPMITLLKLGQCNRELHASVNDAIDNLDWFQWTDGCGQLIAICRQVLASAFIRTESRLLCETLWMVSTYLDGLASTTNYASITNRGQTILLFASLKRILAAIRFDLEPFNVEYIDGQLRYVYYELSETIIGAGSISGSGSISARQPIDCPGKFLARYPAFCRLWVSKFGTTGYIRFDRFMTGIVEPLWGRSEYFESMLKSTLNRTGDQLVTVWRLNCLFRQFGGEPKALRTIIDLLPSGFVAHTNVFTAINLLHKYHPHHDRCTVIWRFSRTYPTKLAYDIYSPLTNRVVSFRYDSSQGRSLIEDINRHAQCTPLDLVYRPKFANDLLVDDPVRFTVQITE